MHIVAVRKKDAHVTPPGNARIRLAPRGVNVRDNHRDRAVFPLPLSYAVKIIFIKALAVCIEHCGFAKNLNVTRPPQPLISLRAVRRNTYGVALLTPKHVLINFIYKRIITLKVSASFQF